MTTDYDALYAKTPEALGPPAKVFVDFFERLGPRKLRVLDAGCGQGRDAPFIARLGHVVPAVDISRTGTRSLREAASREGLGIEAVVADVTPYAPDAPFDVVLIDRTLHLLARDDRLAVLSRLLACVGPDGRLLIADEPRNLPNVRSSIAAQAEPWRIERDVRGILFAQRGQGPAASRGRA